MHSANKTFSHHPMNTTKLKINDITQLMQNRVLRKTLQPKRHKLRGEWEKLHEDQLHYLILLTEFSSHDETEEDEIGRAHSMHRGGQKHIQGFCRKTLEVLDKDGRILLKWIS
jgi:hypothetical protein